MCDLLWLNCDDCGRWGNLPWSGTDWGNEKGGEGFRLEGEDSVEEGG